jgi:signal transduction histidine kinase/DNA-binding NarL/FixJ family response regulator
MDKKYFVLLSQEEVKGEKQVNKLTLIVILCGFILALSNAILVKFHKNVLANFAGICIVLLYHIVLFYVLQKKGVYKSFFKYITVFVNVTFITITIYGYSFASGWVHTLRTMTILGYAIPLALSGFYKRPFISIYAGCLICIEYLLLFFYAILFTNTQMADMESFYTPTINLGTVIFMIMVTMIVSVVIAYFSQNLRTLLSQALGYKTEVEETEARSQLKTNFFINLAHETKTPLTLITNYLDKYIKQHQPDKDLEIIWQNLEKLRQDMVNFLDKEKLQKGQVFYNHELISPVSRILNDKILIFKESAARKNISITSTIEEDLYTKADPYALDRIINNLLTNAIRYNKNAGRIEVMLGLSGPEIQLAVKDTGIGITKEQLSKLFEADYQVFHKKRNIQGIGMGLNIVKQIVDSLGGRIRVESQWEKGSTFAVFLAVHHLAIGDSIEELVDYSPPVGLMNDVELEEEEYKAERKTLLVVEDNRQLLAYLQNELKPEYNVYYALNGKDALKKLKHMPAPSLIVSDIMMDEMDGYEFRVKLIEQKPFRSVPFIFITAKSGLEEKLKGIGAGAVDFIFKPFSLAELKGKIVSLLKLQDALREDCIRSLSATLYTHLKNTGKQAIDETTGEKIKDKIKQKTDDDSSRLYHEYNISRRELEAISLIRHGFEHKEIAARMNISINTLKTYVKKIYEKCAVSNKVELLNLFYG